MSKNHHTCPKGSPPQVFWGMLSDDPPDNANWAACLQAYLHQLTWQPNSLSGTCHTGTFVAYSTGCNTSWLNAGEGTTTTAKPVLTSPILLLSATLSWVLQTNLNWNATRWRH